MIDGHFWPTPNSKKDHAAGGMRSPYTIEPCNLGRGRQFETSFLANNPKNRLPAIVDHESADGGPPLSVFESGAIMMYIAEKAVDFFPKDTRGRADVTQWLVWRMANQGPKSSECGHFGG
jgi:GST-like protein